MSAHPADDDRGSSPSARAERPAESTTEDEAAPERWRAALEMGIGLAGGIVWYVIDDRNVLDWDRPSLKQRLNGEAWRFDNNDAAVNFVFHPIAGAGFYAVARSNYLDVTESFLFGLGASTTWEYVIEFKERVSINDMIVTPLAGMAIGEFAHKLALYVNDAPARNLGEHVAQWSLGPAVRIHRAIDGDQPAPTRPPGSLGGSNRIWHEFAAGYHAGRVTLDSGQSFTTQEIGYRGLLVSLPGFRRPARLRRWFHEAEISRLDLAFTYERAGLDGDLFSEVLLAGYYDQQLEGAGTTRRGSAWTLGASLGCRYRNSAALGFDDRQGIVHFPGPAIDLLAEGGGLRADLSARFHADFAGISTVSFPGWRRFNDESIVKTIVERHQYFYGWGGTAAAWGTISAYPVWVRGALRYGRYGSQQGLDRKQEAVTHDIELSEIVKEYDITLGLRPSRAFGAGLRRRVRHRVSRTEGTSTNRSAEELGLTLEIAL